MRVKYKILCLVLVFIAFDHAKLRVSGQDDGDITSGDSGDVVEDVEVLITDENVEDVENVDAESIDESTTEISKVKINGKSARAGNYFMDDGHFGNLDFGTPNNDNYNWNDPNNRYAPNVESTHRTESYVITDARLREIRSNFMYWFYDLGGNENRGDYVTDIHSSIPQVHKNFNFQLPFYGFRFNYTRVSAHGFLEFSDPPEHYTYPLAFPIKDWPRRNDPSFIGIFFSKCRIGRIRPDDIDQRAPGVYFRQERDLMTRTDRFGVEMRERAMWDIRTGVVGADTFIPKHVVTVTWKNMSFAGGIDNSLFKTNTFQLVLATDEVYTYAIFNYADINWSAHTEAGGDTTLGEGGVPAFIGFNAGNGTQAYEYKPYSQASVLRDLSGRGWGNGFPGRHIFRIDERIMLGSCNKDIDAAHLPLVFAPESGNMLGGTIVNITGPCFSPNERITCIFDTTEVVGHYVDTNRAICVQPFVKGQGYVRFEISVGTDRFKWRGQFFLESAATATERIFFQTNDVHLRNPPEFNITWNRFNLTTNLNAGVMISLWGYRETEISPEFIEIDVLEPQLTNTGHYNIVPNNYRLRDNRANLDIQFGFIKINLTNPQEFSGLHISPELWSKPIPLAWYFGPQWERVHGRNWPRALCDNWFRTDRFLRNFAAELPICPCQVEHAILDKGRFMPDPDCDRDSNPQCLQHRGAVHCVRSGYPTVQSNSEQQCCYDRNGWLMLSYDQMWGSRIRRNHNVGLIPWNEANKVPTLSQWFHDIRPFYSCCRWQSEQAVGCETFRFERRPSQDCVAYQAPGSAAIFGDPHIVTFDNLQYTFNGMGEFVLVRGRTGRDTIDVQGRFQQVPRNIYGPVMATQLTSVVATANGTATIEVRLRPQHAQWRYRLDVFHNRRRIFFDRHSLKFQTFQGVTVYTPSYILNQSEVVMMFDNGVGVEVIENNGFMTARVYLPWTFINRTRGLLGNWSFDMQDDLTRPDDTIVQANLNNFEQVHRDFALHWILSDGETPNVGSSLFTREFGRTASFYANATFRPNFIPEPRDFLPANRSHDVEMAHNLCGDSYQCRFDYGMSLSREMAHFTRNYYDSAVNIRTTNERRIMSCGILETPRFGMKSNFLFIPGSRVSFQCNEGFMLIGDTRRICGADGRWDIPEYGYTQCLREVFYVRRTAWIATGIILIVILPILMCIICVVYCWRKRNLEEDPEWKMPIRSLSRSTLRNINSDTSEMDEGLTKYDKVYRTNEPLEGKPQNDFPSKKWDLDDEDISSSEGSAFRDSKASDIEYKPKQQGRRSMRFNNDYKPIEEEANGYPAPLSPLTSQYSPTYSGLDRNSYENPNNRQPLPGSSNLLGFSGLASPPPPEQDLSLPTSASPTRGAYGVGDSGAANAANGRSTEV